MNHKYIMFTAMYRYELLQFETSKPSAVQVKHLLTTTNPHTWVFGSKRIVKKALRENFGIQNQSDMQQVIDSMLADIWENCAVYSLLIDLYLQHPKDFSTLTPATASAYLKTALPQQKSLELIWNTFHPPLSKVEYMDAIEASAAQSFESENRELIESLEVHFQRSHSWLGLTNGMAMAAFQCSRILSIIADANMCNYLSDEQTTLLCNRYGSITETLFSDWQAFLASAILGKQFMSSANGQFIIDATDYTNSCFKLASHPSKPLELSGIWVGSNTNHLIDSFSNYNS